VNQDTYRNPVIPGFHPDPSVCAVDGRFYLVTSSFEYFPGIPLFVSDDLVTWKQIGHVLDRPEQLHLRSAPASGGLFAPTIRHHDGVFYVTCTNVSAGGHFIVSSVNPEAGWSDPVWIAQDGIDPSLFFDGDDVYFTSNVQPDPGGTHELEPTFRRGIQQSRIGIGTGAILEGPRFIWEGTGARYPEAPHLARRGDWYYLVIAEGGTEYGHIASVGRAHNPWGPFEQSPHGPMIDHRSIASPFQAMGHADLVQLPDDEWWAVCLGIRPIGGWPHHVLGRETFLAPIQWTPDGWPIAGDRGRIGEILPRPSLPAAPTEPHPVRDDFDGPALGAGWNTVRAPIDASLIRRPGWLTLRPDGASVDSVFPCFVGRRQQHHRLTATTTLELAALDDGIDLEAGLMVRMNETHHFALGRRRAGEVDHLVLRQRFAHVDMLTVLGALSPDSPTTMTVVSDGRTYRFASLADGGRIDALALDVKLISTEMAGGFTGVFVGMYATSGDASQGSAQFDWFDYQEHIDS
jgi:xylan 1,4-beta-xylosidase